MSLWKAMALDNISRYPKLRGRRGLMNAMAESGRRLPGRQSKMSGFEVSWEMRRLASTVNWAKNARINSCGYSTAQWVIGRGDKLPWSLLDEKQSGELAPLKLPDHSPELGRRMSWLWAARRAFETMDTSHHLRRALSAGVRASGHTQGIVTSELVLCLAERSRKTELMHGRHSLPIGGMAQPLWSAKRRTTFSFLIVVAC